MLLAPMWIQGTVCGQHASYPPSVIACRRATARLFIHEFVHASHTVPFESCCNFTMRKQEKRDTLSFFPVQNPD